MTDWPNPTPDRTPPRPTNGNDMANGALLLGAVALVIVVAVVRSPIEALGLAAAALLVTGIWLKVKAHRDRDPRVLK